MVFRMNFHNPVFIDVDCLLHKMWYKMLIILFIIVENIHLSFKINVFMPSWFVPDFHCQN